MNLTNLKTLVPTKKKTTALTQAFPYSTHFPLPCSQHLELFKTPLHCMSSNGWT